MKFVFNPFTGQLDAVSTSLTNLDGGEADTIYDGVDDSPVDGGSA